MSTTATTTQNPTTGSLVGRPTLSQSGPLVYKPLHPTFVAEVEGADLTQPTEHLVSELKRGLAQVGHG